MSATQNPAPKITKEKEALKVKYSSNSSFDPQSKQEVRLGPISTPRVKGRLKEHIDFWVAIRTNSTILEVIREGYKIPFYSQPGRKSFSNNRSALNHPDFVEKELKSLLESGRIVETPVKPYVVNPLSVSGSDEKLRLILDLTYVNYFVFKDPIKYDDWKVMEHLVHESDFLFKFDIKSGYHHVDIYPSHQKFLGFSWTLDDVQKYFVFTVLPFGLSTGPFIFTKVMRPLVAYWRSQGIRICCYLDDGLGASQPSSLAVEHSTKVRNTLLASGFVINEEKSIWVPTQTISWLGLDYDSNEHVLRITDKRIASLLKSLNDLIDRLPYTSPRKLSRVCGKVMSTKYVLGNLVRLKNRRLYQAIGTPFSWDSRLS